MKDVNFGIQEGGPYPNTAWLLSIIATYQPEHIFFSKSYKPSHQKKEREIDNSDNFFDDLPPTLTQSKKVKRSQIIKKLLIPQSSDDEDIDVRQPVSIQRKSTKSKASTLTPNMKQMNLQVTPEKKHGKKRNNQQFKEAHNTSGQKE